MHASLTILARVILAHLRRPVVERRIEPILPVAAPVPRLARPSIAAPMNGQMNASPVAIAKTRGADGAEWSDTQPWCHQ